MGTNQEQTNDGLGNHLAINHYWSRQRLRTEGVTRLQCANCLSHARTYNEQFQYILMITSSKERENKYENSKHSVQPRDRLSNIT